MATTASSSPIALTFDQVKVDLSRIPKPLRGGYRKPVHLACRIKDLATVELLGVLRALVEAGQEDWGVEVEDLIKSLRATCPRPFLEPSEALSNSAWSMKDVRPRVSDKSQYMALVKATLPVTFPVVLSSPPSTTLSPARDKDNSEHQAIRDIERDVIVVNGQTYKAGPGGFQLVVKWMADLMESRVNKVWEEAAPSHSTTYMAFAKECLKAVNRTNSGGVAYDCLTERLHIEGLTVIVPDSKRAEPLRVALDVCPFPVSEGGQWAWGICATVEGTTLYDCFDSGVEDRWIKVRARFRHRLYLPIVGAGGKAKKQPSDLPVVTLEEVDS